MTAKSFSVAATLSFTTLPSKASSSERVSFNSAAKSSRVRVNSLDSPIAVLILLLLHTCEVLVLAHPNAKSASPHEAAFAVCPSCEVPSAEGSCANQIAAHPLGVLALANLPYNRLDGHLECGFYSQIAGIQQDRVAGGAHWRGLPARITFIA